MPLPAGPIDSCVKGAAVSDSAALRNAGSMYRLPSRRISLELPRGSEVSKTQRSSRSPFAQPRSRFDSGSRGSGASALSSRLEKQPLSPTPGAQGLAFAPPKLRANAARLKAAAPLLCSRPAAANTHGRPGRSRSSAAVASPSARRRETRKFAASAPSFSRSAAALPAPAPPAYRSAANQQRCRWRRRCRGRRRLQRPTAAPKGSRRARSRRPVPHRMSTEVRELPAGDGDNAEKDANDSIGSRKR